jgi:hypothetical protein
LSFEQHLNESSEENPHTNQELSRGDDVVNDVPDRDEIVKAIDYLTNNKAAGSDSKAAELLKTGGPRLVYELSKVLQ